MQPEQRTKKSCLVGTKMVDVITVHFGCKIYGDQGEAEWEFASLPASLQNARLCYVGCLGWKL